MAKKQYRKAKSLETSSDVVSPVVNTTRNRLSSSDFNPDYTFIKKDLRRIGILASSFIGILIVLTFFLR